jgi:hypothetical protein
LIASGTLQNWFSISGGTMAMLSMNMEKKRGKEEHKTSMTKIYINKKRFLKAFPKSPTPFIPMVLSLARTEILSYSLECDISCCFNLSHSN